MDKKKEQITYLISQIWKISNLPFILAHTISITQTFCLVRVLFAELVYIKLIA